MIFSKTFFCTPSLPNITGSIFSSLFKLVAVFQLQMISLPFSIGTYNPINHLTPALRSITRNGNNPHIIESSAVNLNETKYSATNSAVLSRREAIGIGFSFTFLQFLDPKPRSTAAEGAASPPCEFTASPSGLAYCDKVIGTGTEAVKGQLIKVTKTLRNSIVSSIRFSILCFRLDVLDELIN